MPSVITISFPRCPSSPFLLVVVQSSLLFICRCCSALVMVAKKKGMNERINNQHDHVMSGFKNFDFKKKM